ncbi:hypothetical protein AZE42_12529, partial [Rhizopogon vesiculosus]
MDFCSHIVGSTDPQMIAAVKARQAFFICLNELSHVILNFDRLDPAPTSPSGPVMVESDLDRLFGDDDDEAKAVLGKISIGKHLHKLHNNPTYNFGVKEHFGFKAVLERGKLGLVN